MLVSMTASPYKPTTETETPIANRAVTSNRFGPSLVELLFVLTGCLLFSFRFTGLIAMLAVAVVFCRTDRSLPRYTAMILTAAIFIAPYDVRFAGSTQHYGTSTQAASVVPVFGCCQTAHSYIRARWPEYYTSHIPNRPKWILSLDLGKL